MEGDNIGVYKACIKDANSLKDLTIPSLFSESNGLDLGSIPSFLSILTIVEELLIICIYVYL
jgi:stage V sporulation protein SpoVS